MDQCINTRCEHLFPLSLHLCVLHCFMSCLSLRPAVFGGQVKRLSTLSGELEPVGRGYAYVVLESALDCQDTFKVTMKHRSSFKWWNKVNAAKLIKLNPLDLLNYRTMRNLSDVSTCACDEPLSHSYDVTRVNYRFFVDTVHFTNGLHEREEVHPAAAIHTHRNLESTENKSTV